MEANTPVHLIIRYLSNEATTDEQEQLFNWVALSSENQKIFNEWVNDWNKVSSEGQLQFDLDYGLRSLNQKIDQIDQPIPKSHSSLVWNKAAVAAAVLLLVTTASLYFLFDFRPAADKEVYVERFNPAGEKLTLTLADGTTVKLNSNTSLKYPEEFNEATREVFLNGEAFFEVKKDSLHPFIVHTGELTTKVLGTSFNINSNGDHVSVSVATGVVKVSQGDLSTVLHPKDRVDYSASDKTLIRSVADLQNVLAWKENTLVFQDTPLIAAGQKLSAWYGVTIVFDNDSIKQCLITGKFVSLPLEKVLHAISFSTGLTYTINDKTITLSGKGCE